MKKIIFGALAICTLFASCDTKDIPKIDVSIEKALMDQKWKIAKLEVNPDINQPGNSWNNVGASTDPCIMDNRLIFTSKFDVVMDEHYRKCSETDPQTRDFKYALFNDNYLKIGNDPYNETDPGYMSGDFKLVDINTFTLDVHTSSPTVPDVVTSTKYTFTKTKN
ncbi:MAG TPA: hypothetical protein VLZ83_13755 [Edaphocola sp.]|nr:hypothetical protein [Edaphocola sp.]